MTQSPLYALAGRGSQDALRIVGQEREHRFAKSTLVHGYDDAELSVARNL
jgi:hypothetical protein